MDKLEYFREAMGREVEARRLKGRHRAANELSVAAAVELEAAQAHVDSRVEHMRAEVGRKANVKIAAAVAEARAAYIAVRTAGYERLDEEVAADLEAFAKTAEYGYYLPERINAMKNELNFNAVKVKIPARHMRYAEEIGRRTGLKVEAGEVEFTGGFILQNETGRVQADFTFETRLGEARPI
jgi:vacuolar-type H+-ATPase subunit E/Vma4